MKKEKGFTLIELLVVVSVIAILASVVLVNLRGARERAMDSRVISALGQTRAVAEIIFSRDASYALLCAGTPLTLRTDDIANGLNLLQTEITGNNGGVIPVCFTTITDYCVSARLNTAGQFWCITSAGRSGRATGPCTSATACPWVTP